MDWFKLIICLAGSALGIFLFVRVFRKHRKIDTESIAEVSKVESLGRDDFKKVYAIWYKIHSSEPFELLVTPCKKPLEIGDQKGIFYEKANAKKNYYFKTIKSFDKRFVLPSAITIACLATSIHTIVNAFLV